MLSPVHSLVFTVILLSHIGEVYLGDSETTSQTAGEDKSRDSSNTPKKQVLVFGGNGFLGSATVGRLLQRHGDLYDITIANRGTWYWDSALTIKPYVRSFSCDREKPIHHCTRLREFVDGIKQFEAVIDFSAYSPFAVDQALRILDDKVRLYIFISTDSVYEVCPKYHNDPTREADCFRPEKLENVDNLDTYGHLKLQCEERLIKARQDGGFPSIILRLPDVIGPRDNTHRWWSYQMWIRLAEQYIKKIVAIPDFLLALPISLVYSEDVATLIADILDMEDQAAISDQVYNLAFEETLTLPIVLNDMSLEMGLGNLTFLAGSSQYLYPSVKKGAINITKAFEMLPWKPTPWKRALTETVKFYEEAMGWVKYAPRENMMEGFLKDIAKDDKEGFVKGLKELYNYEPAVGLNVKDEL